MKAIIVEGIVEKSVRAKQDHIVRLQHIVADKRELIDEARAGNQPPPKPGKPRVGLWTKY